MFTNMLAALILTLALTASPVFAQATGDLWEKSPEEFRVGYVLGLMNAMNLFQLGSNGNENVTEMARRFSACGGKRGITAKHLLEALRGYIATHQEEKAEELIILAIRAQWTLCH